MQFFSLQDYVRRSRRHPAGSFGTFVAPLLTLFFVLGLPAGFFGFGFFLLGGFAGQGTGTAQFSIEEGIPMRQIAQKLFAQGFIRFPVAFQILAVLTDNDSKLQAGEHTLPKSATSLELLSLLTRPTPRVAEVRVTIPEGFTVSQIDARLAGMGLAQTGEFANAAIDIARYPVIAAARAAERSSVRLQDLEGYLFPDTYRVVREQAVEDLAGKMLQNFEEKMRFFAAHAPDQARSARETIIVASLIEREVRSDQDRKFVADVIWKRFDAGIPLQIDASVRYAYCAAGGELCESRENLRYEDLAIDSPYNTYRRKGLPPAPIANPGLSSILAAVQPEPSPYWYYLSAPDGTTVFSRTLDEHNLAKAKYLR